MCFVQKQLQQEPIEIASPLCTSLPTPNNIHSIDSIIHQKFNYIAS